MMEILRVLADGTGSWPSRSASSPVRRSLRYQLVRNGWSSHSACSCAVSGAIMLDTPFVVGSGMVPSGAPPYVGRVLVVGQADDARQAVGGAQLVRDVEALQAEHALAA